MKDLPWIRILPDHEQGRDEERGQVLEFEVDASDNALRALVAWSELASYRNYRTRARKAWLPVAELAPIDGQDYTRVPRKLSADAQLSEPTVAEGAPPGWPAGVPTPQTPGWEKHAISYLLDLIPPGYRAYPVFRQHPVALVKAALHHLALAGQGLKDGYRSAPYTMKQHLEPHVIEELLETYRMERDRLAECWRAVKLIENAFTAGAQR